MNRPTPPSHLMSGASLALLFAAACGVTVLLALAALAWAPPNNTCFALILDGDWLGSSPDRNLLLWLEIGLVLTPLVLTAALWKLGLRSRRWSGGTVFLLIPVFTYMATDEAALRDPLTMADAGPAFPRAEASYAVLSRYATNTAAARNFQPPGIVPAKWPGIGTDEWETFVRENHNKLAAAWVEIMPIRSWWIEWSRFPQVGDLLTTNDEGIVSARVIRSYALLACAEATWDALEGRSDDALEILLPLLDGAQKLEPSARELTRLMLARMAMSMAIDTIDLTQRRAGLSSDGTARLIAILSTNYAGDMGARRVVAVDFAGRAETILRKHAEGSLLTGILGRSLGPVVFNPRRTINQIRKTIHDMQEHAVRREFDALERTATNFLENGASRSGIKNVAGGYLGSFILPSFRKVTERYWAVEDRRTALIAKLKTENVETALRTNNTGTPHEP